MTVKTMVETWKSSIGDAPLTHEDHEQRGDEAEDGGAFGQGAAQQQGAVDLTGGSGWRAIASLALPVAIPIPIPAPMPVITDIPIASIPIPWYNFLLKLGAGHNAGHSSS